MGRNGVGKTTLLRALVNGFGVRVVGEVSIDGSRTESMSCDRVIRDHRVAFVPDDRRIFPLTVMENLRVAALSAKDWAEQADRVLGYFPFLKDHTSQLATTLSGGEQQALAIARAAMGSPRYLLLDEPCEGLAPIAMQNLVDGVIDLRRELGCTVVLVERNMRIIEALCSEAYGMSAGSVIWKGAVHELLDDSSLLDHLLHPAASKYSNTIAEGEERPT
jgi:branched-chain amino acid transport system ATP-binding protein